MTTTATEEAPVETPESPPLGEVGTWRQENLAPLLTLLSDEAEAALARCYTGMALHAMAQQAGYLQPLPVLPKRVRGASQPYTPGLLVTGQVPAAEDLPPGAGDAMAGFTPMPFSEEALANVEKRATEEALAQHEAASKADLGRWAKGETFDDEKAKEATENFLDHHDTDPAGESAGETTILPFSALLPETETD